MCAQAWGSAPSSHTSAQSSVNECVAPALEFLNTPWLQVLLPQGKEKKSLITFQCAEVFFLLGKRLLAQRQRGFQSIYLPLLFSPPLPERGILTTPMTLVNKGSRRVPAPGHPGSRGGLLCGVLSSLGCFSSDSAPHHLQMPGSAPFSLGSAPAPSWEPQYPPPHSSIPEDPWSWCPFPQEPSHSCRGLPKTPSVSL